MKLVRKIEFDPYFCGVSAIQPLCKVLQKFGRLLSSLTLIPSRTGVKDEARCFSSIIERLKKISKFKIEIRSNSEINFQDYQHLTTGGRRFYSLKTLHLQVGWSKDLSKNLHLMAAPFQNSFREIEEIKFHVCFSHSEPSSTAPAEDNKRKKEKKGKISKTLKSLSFKFSFKTGWESYFDGTNPVQGFHGFLQTMPSWTNPIHLSFTFDKTCASLDTIKAFAHVLPQLTNLRFLFLEFNSIKLSDFELLILSKGFVDCKQIEHLIFKYLDKFPIAMMDIWQFISILANSSVFPKFDLFFRKLFYSEWQTPEAKNKLAELENVSCILTKQSLHVQKKIDLFE